MDEQETKNKIEYTIALTGEFAKAHGLTDSQAFRYLDRYKGIDFILHHYGIAHTQSFCDMVEALGDVCQRNGGGIAPKSIQDQEWLRRI